MFLFVKKRNSIEPIQLVPWKSIALDDKKKDLEIPIKATIISSVYLILFFIFSISYLILDNFWYFFVSVSLYYVVPLPLLLVFTIKQKQIGKKNIQPPQKLQFHGDKFSNSISKRLQLHEDTSEEIEKNPGTVLITSVWTRPSV